MSNTFILLIGMLFETCLKVPLLSHYVSVLFYCYLFNDLAAGYLPKNTLAVTPSLSSLMTMLLKNIFIVPRSGIGNDILMFIDLSHCSRLIQSGLLVLACGHRNRNTPLKSEKGL